MSSLGVYSQLQICFHKMFFDTFSFKFLTHGFAVMAFSVVCIILATIPRVIEGLKLNLLCMHLYLTCSRLVWLPTAEQVTPVTILLCKIHSGFP